MRRVVFETIDTVICCITDRFEQEGYQMYSEVEQLLMKTERADGEVDEVLKFYGSDFENNTLLTQLRIFHTNYPTEMSA